MASSSDGATIGAGEKETALVSCIHDLCAEHDLEAVKMAVETMLRLANNIIQHPDDEKYKRVKTGNKAFASKVWRLPEAQQFMFVWGWTEADDAIVLPTDTDIQLVKQTLQRRLNLITSLQKSASSDAAMSEKEKTLQEERKHRQEQAKHDAEEKKRIRAQIQADRQNLKDRHLKDSKARHLHGGGGMTKFGDIGVDLDGSGGGGG